MIRDLLKEIGGTVILLFLGMVFFTTVLIFVEYRFKDDAQVFQVVSNIVSGFTGAFFAMMTSRAKTAPAAPPAQVPAAQVNP